MVDLNAPFQAPLLSRPGETVWAADAKRRLLTTFDDIGRAVQLVHATAHRYGRRPPLVTVNIDEATLVEAADVRDAEAQRCQTWGLAARSLTDCPYLLLGPPAAIAAKLDALRRAGVSAVAVGDGADHVCAVRDEVSAFADESEGGRGA